MLDTAAVFHTIKSNKVKRFTKPNHLYVSLGRGITPMRVEEIPVQDIATLYERDVTEVERDIQVWVSARQERNRPLVPDIRLLATVSQLSVTSVSNHLRQKSGSLSKTKAERLTQLINMIGYVPSSAAQHLRRQQRHSIGIALPLTSISPEFYLQMLAGVKREADLLGYQQLIFDVTTESARKEFFQAMPFLGIVDGLITVGLHIEEERLNILRSQNVPITAVHTPITHPTVVANILPASESALQDLISKHLIQHHGYRKLALVTLETANPLKTGDATKEDWTRLARVNAYVNALADNNIILDKNLIFEVPAHTFEAGCYIFKQIQAANDRLPDSEKIQAVVCTSDTLAAALLTAARNQNIDMPVTGFDNLSIANLLGLTTVAQNPEEVGRSSFRHLYNAFMYQQRKNEYPSFVEEKIDMKIIVRQSCGCQ